MFRPSKIAFASAFLIFISYFAGVCSAASVCAETDGPCFSLSTENVSWSAASVACGGGAQLASIPSPERQEFLNTHISDLSDDVADEDEFWFGAHYEQGTGGWRWTRNTLEAVTESPAGITLPPVTGDETASALIFDEGEMSGGMDTEHNLEFVNPAGTLHNVLCETDDELPPDGNNVYFAVDEGNGKPVRHFHAFHTAADKVSWAAADRLCVSARGWLAVIDDGPFLDLVQTAIGDMEPLEDISMWIGLHVGQWQWEDDVALSEADLENFPTGEVPVGCGYLIYNATDTELEWMVDNTCGGPRQGICETVPAPEGSGLSDGEIAAIVVCSSLAVGGAAAGGGYYAYNKKSSTKVDPETGDTLEREDGDREEGDEEEEPKEDEAETVE